MLNPKKHIKKKLSLKPQTYKTLKNLKPETLKTNINPIT